MFSNPLETLLSRRRFMATILGSIAAIGLSAPALADWLDASQVRSFGAMILDMYPKGPVGKTRYASGDNPFLQAAWFDRGNYTISPNPLFKNLWIQGGPRARTFFGDNPSDAPALNKIPFVKWNRRYAYVSSTHMMLPRGLNLVYDQSGGEIASGILLHAKFVNTFAERAKIEAARKEHFNAGQESAIYAANDPDNLTFWGKCALSKSCKIALIP